MIDLRKKDDMIAAIEKILQQEALKGNQHLIDKNKNNKVDPEDFKILRGEKKAVKEEETVDEGIKELAKKAFKAVTGGSDEDQRKDLQRKMGLPQTGKKPVKEEIVEEEVEIVYEANIEPTDGKSRSHISNLSNPTVNGVTHQGKQIGLITKQSNGEYHAHHSAAKLAHAAGATFDSKDKAHQFLRNAHAKAIKNGTLKSSGVKEEAMSHQASTTMKHISNASPALKKAAKDIKPGVAGYRDRVDMLKAGGVKEETVDESLLGQLRDRGNVATGQKQQDRKNFDTNTGAALKPNSTISGIRAKMQNKVQEEAEEVDESKGMPLHRRRGNALNSDADRLAKRDKPNDFGDSPRYPQGKNLLKVRLKASQGKHTTPNLPEEIELIDELSKSTLGSYVKKAAADSTISRKIGADFENRANLKRSPYLKVAASELADKFKSDSRKRKANVDKAVDRLTKEERQPKTLRQFKEGWEEMMADVKKRAEPKPNGGSGVKQGSRYGGSKQKDTPEQDTEKK